MSTGDVPHRGPLGRLLQSGAEWSTRNDVLAASMVGLISRFGGVVRDGLDVGCQQGALTDLLNERTAARWAGVDPVVADQECSPRGASLIKGRADEIPFPDEAFDVLVLANVFEHIVPDRRDASLVEMHRVLRPGGIVVGQIPNPYFPIESHSRLPFMGWLPIEVQRRYWKFAPVPWEHDFYCVTPRDVAASASAAGLEVIHKASFNYPAEVVPATLRPVARAFALPMRIFPWAWQFVIKRN